jgi:uncharacterized membrane protein
MLAILFPGIQHLQNIHPLLVHFPIAFLVGAMLLYALAGIFPRLNLGDTAFSLLILGTLSAAAAVGSGLYAEDGVRVSRSVREHLLEVHEKFMIATSALSVVLSAWAVAARPFPRRGRPVFLLLFLGLLILMALGADYGARMVYDYNTGGSASSQPMEFTR